MAFLLTGIGLKILAGIAIVAVAGGLILRHDHGIRVAEEAKWKPKVEECQKANVSLDSEFKAFVGKHNAEVEAAAKRSKAAKDARGKALAAAAKADATEQPKIDAARALAAAAPQANKEAACAQADAILRNLAAELVR